MEEQTAAHGASNGSAAFDPAPTFDPAGADAGEESHPARELTMHLLRMLETRIDAAGIALNSEIEMFSLRLQLKLLAAAAVFISIWGAIVLIAIVLPDPYRVPVLGVVIAGFVALAVWAHLAAKRAISTRAVGSMHWFLDGLKLDFEVLSRSLAPRAPPPTDKRSSPSDLAS
ncbi:MAG: hypothetical protein H7Y89_17900 [Steroidobacteraceae bacterium]|nr:hypothetical protein [Steroidobacteraceae bacterium]